MPPFVGMIMGTAAEGGTPLRQKIFIRATLLSAELSASSEQTLLFGKSVQIVNDTITAGVLFSLIDRRPSQKRVAGRSPHSSHAECIQQKTNRRPGSICRVYGLSVFRFAGLAFLKTVFSAGLPPAPRHTAGTVPALPGQFAHRTPQWGSQADTPR